jgi:glutamine synthetase
VNAVRLTGFLQCDLVSVVRGRFIPTTEVERRLPTGAAWVPANLSFTPFGPVSEFDPHGPTGDVRLLPDPATRVTVEFGENEQPLDFFLCDVVRTDLSPWDCCPRTFLARALDALEREAGVRLLASFEHEFQLVDESPSSLPFTLAGHRRVEPFGPVAMAALQQAGVEPEFFFPEYGPHQFEITCEAVEGVAAADRSAIFKEVVRDAARVTGRQATFAPLQSASAVGNGCHIHFSFLDTDGRPALYDASRPAGLSELGGQFAAGVLEHVGALSAFVTPGASSFLRLAPHRWSVGAACLGERNRETLLRVSPVIEMPGRDPAREFNLELRAADATACPYLALGALVHAGLDGIRRRLECPPILDRDPTVLSPEELAGYGARALPGSLEDALRSLDEDETARGWLPPLLYETYVGIKRSELAHVEGLDPDEICRLYADAY